MNILRHAHSTLYASHARLYVSPSLFFVRTLFAGRSWYAPDDIDQTTANNRSKVLSVLKSIVGPPEPSNKPKKSKKSKKVKKVKKVEAMKKAGEKVVTVAPQERLTGETAGETNAEKELSIPGSDARVPVAFSPTFYTTETQTTGWGKDEFSTANSSAQLQKPEAPHVPHDLPYIRRLEGVLAPVHSNVLEDIPPLGEHRPIASLSHGLDRVLFNPGVHWMQDPRSRVYNFHPWLQSIPKVQDFDFERISTFVKSSRDEDLVTMLRRENRRFGGSTSSLSGMLSHIYFLLSGNREVDITNLSHYFLHQPQTFTPGQRAPASVIANYFDGVYAIDSDSPDSEKNILSWMGHLLENFLTKSPEEFSKLMRSSSALEEDSDPRRDAYRWSKSNKFVMRSQLDAMDPRLPGTGVFDLKTRGVLPLRLDMLNYEENSGYIIRRLHGTVESFEKEYYDLIRSAFLKYSFQARIGNMDGVFVAYHNTARLLGFQYIPLEEMEERLYGGKQRALERGDRIFERCVGLLENILDEVVQIFPEQSVSITFETPEEQDTMQVWVQPTVWDEETGPRPIAQFDVSLTSYIDGAMVRRSHAISEVDSSWVVHWSISLSAKDADLKRHALQAAKSRQLMGYNIPSGLGFEDMAKYWKSLNFGGTELSKDSYDPRLFRMPNQSIQNLRKLAQAGKADTAEEAQKRRPKTVWGVADYMEDEEAAVVEQNAVEAEAPVDVVLGPTTEEIEQLEMQKEDADAIEQSSEGHALTSAVEEEMDDHGFMTPATEDVTVNEDSGLEGCSARVTGPESEEVCAVGGHAVSEEPVEVEAHQPEGEVDISSTKSEVENR